MQIAVVGAGGVGGYFGGVLAHSGAPVVFIARGAQLRAIRTRGLRIEAPGGGFLLAPVDATDDPAEIGPVDLVLLCVKTYDLAEAIEQCRPLVGPHTAVLTLQNGVEAPGLAAAAFGAAAVLPGLVYSEVSLREPGVIVQGDAPRRIVLGEPGGESSARAQQFAAAFVAAGVDAVVSPNIGGALWTKFCFICALGGCTTLMRQPLGALLADPEGRSLIELVMAEVRAVGLAHGVRFDADPVAQGMAIVTSLPYQAQSSMQRDRERGGRLEVEALNGAVVRLGRAHGLAAPANQAIYAALRLAQP